MPEVNVSQLFAKPPAPEPVFRDGRWYGSKAAADVHTGAKARIRIPPGMAPSVTVDGVTYEADAKGFVLIPEPLVALMRDSHGLLEA